MAIRTHPAARVAVQRLLAPDMAYAGATTRQILSQAMSGRGAVARVVTEAHVHIHWSARAP